MKFCSDLVTGDGDFKSGGSWGIVDGEGVGGVESGPGGEISKVGPTGNGESRGIRWRAPRAAEVGINGSAETTPSWDDSEQGVSQSSHEPTYLLVVTSEEEAYQSETLESESRVFGFWS